MKERFKVPIWLILVGFTLVFVISVLYINKTYDTSKQLDQSKDAKDDKQPQGEDTFNMDVESINGMTVKGKDILDLYERFSDTDIAILVATKNFLNSDKDSLYENEEYPFIRYVISEGDKNVAESVMGSSGMKVPLAFVNYNAVLVGTCIYHRASDDGYETRYGFTMGDKGEGKTIFTPLVSDNKNEIYKIKNSASFASKTIKNIDGDIVGCAFIEQ